MSDISVAIVGDGLATRLFHAPFIQAVPGLKLAGIVKRSGEQTSVPGGLEKTYRSYQEAVADSTVDLLVIATPNDSHYEIARAAIEARKHLVIDKPVTETSAQMLELIQLAEDAGVVLAPFHNRRFDGDFITVRELCDAQSMGRIVRVHSAFDSFRPKVRTATWREDEGVGSGLLYDLGPHLFDQAVALFGLPKSIFCHVAKERDDSRVVDAFNAILEFDQDNGCSIQYHCSANKLSAEPSARFIIHGTEGTFIKYGLDPQEDAVEAGVPVPRWDSTDVWGAENESNWGELTAYDEAQVLSRDKNPTANGDYRTLYANVRNVILGETPTLFVKPEDGLIAIQLIECAIESSQRKMTIDLKGRLGVNTTVKAAVDMTGVTGQPRP